MRSGIDGRIGAIEKHEIKVDHAGTIITKKEVDFGNSTVKELGTTFRWDYTFDDEVIDINKFSELFD